MVASQVTDVLPERSEGVLVAPFADGWAVYDLVEDRIHVLDHVAGWLVQCGGAPLQEIIDEAVTTTGASPDRVAPDIRTGIAALTDAGLLGREQPWPAPAPVHTRWPHAHGATLGEVHAVLDQRLTFHCEDVELLAEIDHCLGMVVDDSPTVVFDAAPTPEGGVSLQAMEEWEFPDRRGFLIQLPGVVNDFASHDQSMLVLHAGAVRTPDGRLLVLPGVPEAGKSTLTAALVQAGCDYLGDELIGVRADTLQAVGNPGALVLDDTSRHVLGLHDTDTSNPHVEVATLRPDARSLTGDAGPVSEVILPTFDESATEVSVDDLAPVDALTTLLSATMNLDRSREIGWTTLCQMAERLRITRLRHDHAPALATMLIERSTR